MTFPSHTTGNRHLTDKATDEVAAREVRDLATTNQQGDAFSLWLSEELAMIEARYDSFVTRNSLRRYFNGQQSAGRSQR